MATDGKLPTFGFGAGAIGFVVLLGFGSGAPIPPTPSSDVSGGGRSYGREYGTTNSGHWPRGTSQGWLNRDYRPEPKPTRLTTQRAHVVVSGIAAPMRVGQALVRADVALSARVRAPSLSAPMCIGQARASAGTTVRVRMPVPRTFTEDEMLLLLLAAGRRT